MQKTTFDVRISDWSSDVGSSDRPGRRAAALDRVDVNESIGHGLSPRITVWTYSIPPIRPACMQHRIRATMAGISRGAAMTTSLSILVCGANGTSEERRIGQDCVR